MGYRRDLRLDVSAYLQTRQSWLDLCCGEGRALAELAPIHPHCQLVGLDLVDFFAPLPDRVQTVVSPLEHYRPDGRFDLITCVHGLHYLGDKLLALELASSWLRSGGLLLAHLDLDNLRIRGKRPGPHFLRHHGLEYHPRFRLLRCQGPVHFGLDYLGADDRVGPNFTGQAAVTSHYA